MKILHTSDWHVGKTIKRRKRYDEYHDVLEEIIAIAQDNEVDATIVAGDIFDVQIPSSDAEKIVYSAIKKLADIAPVLLIAGNHDGQKRWHALRHILATNKIYAVGKPTLDKKDSVIRLTSQSGLQADVALLPFLHKREAVTSYHILDPTKTELDFHIAYNDVYHSYVQSLCDQMDPSLINILVSHVSTFGGQVGGGEREIHVLDPYSIAPERYPQHLDYVALGHLHPTQTVYDQPTTHYCGAPIHLDYGETAYRPAATIVTFTQQDKTHFKPHIKNIPILAGRPLRSFKGTPAELLAITPPQGMWLRVFATEVEMGDAKQIQDHFGDDLVELRISREEEDSTPIDMSRIHGQPRALFAEYLNELGIENPALLQGFSELYEQVETVFVDSKEAL